MRRALVGLILLLPAVANADEPLRINVALEAGTEADSNARRQSTEGGSSLAENPAVVGRAGARLELGWRPHRRQSLRLSALAAAKKYEGLAGDVSDEDVAVASGDLRWDVALASRPLALGARASWYEAMERDTFDTDDRNLDHDFRTGDLSGAVTLRGDAHQLAVATAGWRFFQYKPNRDYDFAGEHVSLAWRRTIQPDDDPDAEDPGASWDLTVGYAAHHRSYTGPAYANLCAPGQDLANNCVKPSGTARADLLHIGSAEIGYTDELILGARYELHVNDSTSFGQSLVRHRVEVTATAELPFWQIILTAKGILQVNQFLDPVLLARDIGVLTIDEENRNALVLHLTRDLGEHVTAEAKISFYSNEFATQELTFRRLTAYLGVVARWDNQ